MRMIRCGLIGFGHWGPFLAKSLVKIPNVHLSMICDHDEKKLTVAKKNYPFATLVNDVNQVFNEKTIRAVIIATPVSTHFTLAKKALEKNKDVFIEKPLTDNLADAKKLITLNKKVKKIVMVGHVFEYNPSIIKIKELVKKRALGKIYYIQSSRLNFGQIRKDVNALWNLVSHDISIFNFLFDTIPTACISNGSSSTSSEIDDVVSVTFEYPENLPIYVQATWLYPLKERRITIIGAKKMLLFDDLNTDTPLQLYDKNVRTTSSSIKMHSGDTYFPVVEKKEPLFEELKYFFTCIEEKKTPRTDLQNGLRVVKVLEACQKSLKKKNKWINI